MKLSIVAASQRDGEMDRNLVKRSAEVYPLEVEASILELGKAELALAENSKLNDANREEFHHE
ncbi:hypothetical protein J2W30_001483 [Variovorax boronicumulans]|uniref:hypothetical protein n=1 Tax=Variovorax TaxID=34072 RepID=UPI00278558A3|nr:MULTISPECIES: hypothetical protein [Variovorax]MDQ0033736.1 hypothetical protein [Variovorax boronicumulans]MDQ0606260.1 hypothetical protein [Variovorax sp. W1I1]